jgi:hypothetical protein
VELVASCQAVLHLLEVGKPVCVVPGLHPEIGCPTLEWGLPRWKIIPLILLEPPSTLPRVGKILPPVHVGLRLALAAPVIEPVPDRYGRAAGVRMKISQM